MMASTCCLVLSASFMSSLQAEELRDPFTFGPRAGEVQHAQQPTLVGILWDATHPLAIIGEEMVGVGAVVSGWRIVEIKQEGIVIQRDDHRELLAPGTPLPNN